MNGFELLKRCALLVHPSLSATDKAVLCVLAAHYNMNDGCAFPSLVTVQKESGCGSMHTVIKAISRLKAAGLITVRKSFARNARYFFNVHSIATFDITAKSGSNAESDSNVKSDNHSIATFDNHSIATFGNLTNKKNKKEEQITPSPDGDGVSPAPFSLTNEETPRRPVIPACPYQKVADLYNSKLGSTLPAIRFITDARKPKMKRLWEFLYKLCECCGENEGLIAMGWYFDRVAASSFITGQKNHHNGSSWKGDFDFLLREDVRTRLLEGSYDR